MRRLKSIITQIKKTFWKFKFAYLRSIFQNSWLFLNFALFYAQFNAFQLIGCSCVARNGNHAIVYSWMPEKAKPAESCARACQFTGGKGVSRRRHRDTTTTAPADTLHKGCLLVIASPIKDFVFARICSQPPSKVFVLCKSFFNAFHLI